MDPEIMLFDEPTSALDPELIGEVLNVMKKLADRGITMVIVTHELGFARSVAHDIIFLDQGEILESGSPEKLFNNPENERARRFFSRISELY